MAFYYVDRSGVVRLGRVHGPDTIKLETGEVLPDPPPDGQLFSTEVAALKFSELIRLTNGNMKAALRMHQEWVLQRGQIRRKR